jgi:hypothetical protein
MTIDNPSVDTKVSKAPPYALLKERGGEDNYNDYGGGNPWELGILLKDTNSITGNVFDGWEAPAWRSRSTNRS